jgi:sulfoxide reductase catalytic subunit YedY
MVIKKAVDIPSSEITSKALYETRRTFLRGAVVAGSLAATGFLYRRLLSPAPRPRGAQVGGVLKGSPHSTVEAKTSYEDITSYNNFYEFSTDKYEVAERAKGFRVGPWTVAVEGHVHKPRVFDLDDLLKLSPPDERIYRLRCVEGWSMVIPWLGFPLSALLKAVQPTSQAKFVEFVTLKDPTRMPNQKSAVLDWPYAEGLRLDEAMHPLTILASGLYGEALPPQNGAPLRLVVPWKYGFKSIKSIVTLRLVSAQPKTTWAEYAPDEYGFYSNVNPKVPHPRWSQAKERRIGEFGKRDTLPFNGYADQVASLYAGMDLKRFF